MLQQVIEYVDFDGNKRKETFHFNLSKDELVMMEHSIDGGMERLLRRIIETEDKKELMKLFREIILSSYGEKSADGKRFIKSEELSTAFSQTPAYTELFMMLFTDPEASERFINGVIPALPEPLPEKK